MKKIFYNHKIFAVLFLVAGMSSCDALLDDEITDYGNGPDFVGFTDPTVTVPFEVDGSGEVETFDVTLDLFGPGSETFDEPVVVTFEVDEASSTAEEGINYALPGGNTITLNEENNFTASFPVTVYTEGIVPPVSKTLVFDITDVSTESGNEVVISDTADKAVIKISYNCFADLTGTYTLTNSVCDAEVTDVTIEANGEGGWYLSTADGGLLQYCTSNTSLQNDGNILVICGEVEASTDVAYCESNGIGCITGGSWDPETGTLTLTHNDTFFGVGDYTSTYVRTSTSVD